jgi:hypothetical protein
LIAIDTFVLALPIIRTVLWLLRGRAARPAPGPADSRGKPRDICAISAIAARVVSALL